jgi:hypothetical protein
MSMPTLPSSGDPGNKDWWKKPENRTTTIFIVLAGAAVIYFWGLLLPFLLSVADDTLHLVLTGAALAAVYLAFTSKRIRYLARLINRWITGWFVAIDPIGIRKNHIEETEKKKKELEDSTAEIRGLRIKLKQKLDANTGAYNQSMKLLQTAKNILSTPATGRDEERRRQAQRTMSSESKHSDGLSNLINKQQDHMQHYNMVLNVLTRYGEVCDDVILDLKREVDMQEQDMEESRGFAKGMRAAFGIFSGGGQGSLDFEMDDMARQQIEQQYSQRMGEVENFLDLTKDVIAKADFNDEAALADVQNKLDKWSGQDAQMQIGRGGSTKKELIAAASGEDVKQQPAKEVGGEYFK